MKYSCRDPPPKSTRENRKEMNIMDTKSLIINVGKQIPTESSKLFSSVRTQISKYTNQEEKELLNHIISYRDMLWL